MDISERPKEVLEKTGIGDWEADTIVGSKHRGALVSLVDRASKFVFLSKAGTKSAEEGKGDVAGGKVIQTAITGQYSSKFKW